MIGKLIGPVLCLGVWLWTLLATPVQAITLDDATRTVALNDQGETVTLTLREAERGKQLFNAKCGTCHVGGITKTNPVVGLDPESLALATPPRNTVEALVDYMKNPTTYDGLQEIAELHPSLASTDIYPKMRDLTEDDLYAIAGHILIQPKIRGIQWGGGKIYY